ncbi:MAG: hypothetical protein Q8P86_00890 [bacterium]|nr:hypothetical protein [bacterium]
MHSFAIAFTIALLFILVPIVGEDTGLFDEYMRFLEIIVWPLSFILVGFFLRKISAYFLLSVKWPKFFEENGRFKNVREVIEEETDKKFREEKAKETSTLRMEEFKESVGRLKERTKNKDTVLQLAQEIIAENEVLLGKVGKEKEQKKKKNGNQNEDGNSF